MKFIKFTAIAALTLASFGLHAQTNLDANWALVETTDTVDFYIDTTSIKRSGDIVTAWSANTIKDKKMSAKSLKEYNCKTKQERRLTGTIYKKQNFTGETFPMEKKDWDYVVRESIGETVLDFVCKKAPKGLMDYIK